MPEIERIDGEMADLGERVLGVRGLPAVLERLRTDPALHFATRDEVPDPQNLSIRCVLNGEVVQDGTTSDMIFSVAELVSHASRLMTLEPGDIIMTGTPSGVGAATGEFLKAGDVMTVTVGPLGTLHNPVA